MEKDKMFNIISGVLFYYIMLKIFYYLMMFASFGNIGKFSGILFFICYIILPLVVLAMPLIIKFKFNKKFYEAIINSVCVAIIYFQLLGIISYGISEYFSTFSTYKWSNENWHGYRRQMVEDLEEKYDLGGMTKEEVREILGRGDVERYGDDGTYSMGYRMSDGIMYYVFFDENGVVIDAREVA